MNIFIGKLATPVPKPAESGFEDNSTAKLPLLALAFIK
jgi:hypothetical protein